MALVTLYTLRTTGQGVLYESIDEVPLQIIRTTDNFEYSLAEIYNHIQSQVVVRSVVNGQNSLRGIGLLHEMIDRLREHSSYSPWSKDLLWWRSYEGLKSWKETRRLEAFAIQIFNRDDLAEKTRKTFAENWGNARAEIHVRGLLSNTHRFSSKKFTVNQMMFRMNFIALQRMYSKQKPELLGEKILEIAISSFRERSFMADLKERRPDIERCSEFAAAVGTSKYNVYEFPLFAPSVQLQIGSEVLQAEGAICEKARSMDELVRLFAPAKLPETELDCWSLQVIGKDRAGEECTQKWYSVPLPLPIYREIWPIHSIDEIKFESIRLDGEPVNLILELWGFQLPTPISEDGFAILAARTELASKYVIITADEVYKYFPEELYSIIMGYFF